MTVIETTCDEIIWSKENPNLTIEVLKLLYNTHREGDYVIAKMYGDNGSHVGWTIYKLIFNR